MTDRIKSVWTSPSWRGWSWGWCWGKLALDLLSCAFPAGADAARRFQTDACSSCKHTHMIRVGKQGKSILMNMLNMLKPELFTVDVNGTRHLSPQSPSQKVNGNGIECDAWDVLPEAFGPKTKPIHGGGIHGYMPKENWFRSNSVYISNCVHFLILFLKLLSGDLLQGPALLFPAVKSLYHSNVPESIH